MPAPNLSALPLDQARKDGGRSAKTTDWGKGGGVSAAAAHSKEVFFCEPVDPRGKEGGGEALSLSLSDGAVG